MTFAIPFEGGPLNDRRIIFTNIMVNYEGHIYKAICVGLCKIPIRYRYIGLAEELEMRHLVN
jgi:hypothetical protein